MTGVVQLAAGFSVKDKNDHVERQVCEPPPYTTLRYLLHTRIRIVHHTRSRTHDLAKPH